MTAAAEVTEATETKAGAGTGTEIVIEIETEVKSVRESLTGGNAAEVAAEIATVVVAKTEKKRRTEASAPERGLHLLSASAPARKTVPLQSASVTGGRKRKSERRTSPRSEQRTVGSVAACASAHKAAATAVVAAAAAAVTRVIQRMLVGRRRSEKPTKFTNNLSRTLATHLVCAH